MTHSDDPRLKSIQDKISKIKTAKSAAEKHNADKAEDNENMRIGLQAGAELITAIIAGGLIGYGLDKWLSTKPFFLIAMLVLGVITGFVNVWRTTQNIGYKVGYKDQQNKKQEK